MKSNLVTFILFILLLALNFALVKASEISGTISNGGASTQTQTGNTGSISGNVSSPQSSGGGSYSGGGGGFVIPTSYGEPNYSMGTVNVGNQTSYTETPKPSNIPKPTYYGLGGVEGRYISQNLDSTDTDILEDTSSTSTSTQDLNDYPDIEEQTNLNPTQTETTNQQGPFDFFGVSVWFWLVVLLLLILIIAILYMQSL